MTRPGPGASDISPGESDSARETVTRKSSLTRDDSDVITELTMIIFPCTPKNREYKTNAMRRPSRSGRRHGVPTPSRPGSLRQQRASLSPGPGLGRDSGWH